MLIAEDDPHDVFFVRRAIWKAGLPVNPRCFCDGEEALRYLQAVPPYNDRQLYPLPRIILLDIKMPRKDGFEVLQEVRSDPSLKRLVAVMFSSSSLARDIDRAYDLGANAYVVKPADSSQLVVTLRRLYEFWFLTSQFSPTRVS
jgi:CheY-like chemotaxis protein